MVGRERLHPCITQTSSLASTFLLPGLLDTVVYSVFLFLAAGVGTLILCSGAPVVGHR